MAEHATIQKPYLAIIVAMAENRAIGKDGDMPWRLSADLKRFKALTSGKPVIMGRNTWESLPKRPLPKRPNIVVSRNSDYRADGAWQVASVEHAIAMGEAMSTEKSLDEFFIIGGATLYQSALPYAARLYLTEVAASPDADTFFPAFDEDEWDCVETQHVPSDDRNDYPTRYRKLIRKLL